MLQREVETQAAEMYGNRNVEHVSVGFCCRGVCENQSDNSGCKQHNATGALAGGEFDEGAYKSVNRTVRAGMRMMTHVSGSRSRKQRGLGRFYQQFRLRIGYGSRQESGFKLRRGQVYARVEHCTEE
jgi:hypothetical protein